MIELIDGYYIWAVAYGYALCFGEPKESWRGGKVSFNNNIIGYYGSVEKAIEGCRQELIHDFVSETSTTLPEACRAIREISNDIAKLLKEISE